MCIILQPIGAIRGCLTIQETTAVAGHRRHRFELRADIRWRLQRGHESAHRLTSWARDTSLQVLDRPLGQPRPLSEHGLSEPSVEPLLPKDRTERTIPARVRHADLAHRR